MLVDSLYLERIITFSESSEWLEVVLSESIDAGRCIEMCCEDDIIGCHRLAISPLRILSEMECKDSRILVDINACRKTREICAISLEIEKLVIHKIKNTIRV